MPSPALRLRPGSPADVEDMCETVLDAFSGNMLDALAEEIHDPNAQFVVVEDTVASPSALVAFAKWNAPVVGPGTPQIPPLPDCWPADGDPALAGVFFTKLADMHEQIMEGRPHWYLEMIVTRGEYQGLGAGRMLMEWGVKRADEEGARCYLDATPEGKHLYERFGFKDQTTWCFFNETYRHSFMIRNATRMTCDGGPV
ncbi:acyl-CoA N-acyltransferase [Diaporthe sp. PMI_573]|nr:acyl-CoA N-acyltransferase [Diaporthaceae sp. PMI_573]